MKAFGALLLTLVPMGILIFLCAGTMNYWQGWDFLGVFGATGAAITLYLLKHDRKLLERRVKGGPTAEKTSLQKIIMSLASVGFGALLAVPAVDFRFHGSSVPFWAEMGGNLLILTGFSLIAFVFKVNTYTSSTIELAKGQKVISTGPYAIVRHPMYSSSFIYLVGIPLALGSWRGLGVVPVMFPVVIWRMLDEEKLLKKKLKGYVQYCEKVPYRLLPGVW